MSKVYCLYEGTYSVDSSKEFVPFDREKDDPKSRPGSLFIQVNPFLIETPDSLILCDSGLGHQAEEGIFLIQKNIEELGHSSKKIDYVLLSHLHNDHTSGLVNNAGDLVFPNAKHIIQKKEWDSVHENKSSSYNYDKLKVLEESGNIQFVDGDEKISKTIRCEVTGGHTKFHQVFFIETGEELFFFGGDVLPEPEEMFKSFVAKYDFDGKRSKELRAQYWEKGRVEKWIFLFYHAKTIKIGQAQQKGDGSYELKDVE